MGAEISIVTSKGQVVIPSKLRRHLEIKKGTRICFVERDGDLILRPITDQYIEQHAGILKTQGKLLKNVHNQPAED